MMGNCYSSLLMHMNSRPTGPSDLARKPASQKTYLVRALYNYSAREDGDLSFRKGDIIKVIRNLEDGWLFAKNVNTRGEGTIPSNFVGPVKDIESQDWWFDLDRREADKQLILPTNPRGTFLIRRSSTKNNAYALSVRDFDDETHTASIKHYCIREKKNVLYINRNRTFKSLLDLVKHYTDMEDGLCCQLVQPCSKIPETLPFKNLELRRGDIIIEKKLGEGKFGAVSKGLYKNSHPVAIKVLHANMMSTVDFMEEAKKLHLLRHRKLVQLMGICTVGEPMYIITELLSNGDLKSYLQKDRGRKILFTHLLDISAQIAEGMAYLELKQYVHRDLRAANILVGDNNSVKVADFGLARFLPECNLDSEGDQMFPIRWTAPEALEQNDFSTKSDVWSYGILLYEIVTFGQVPYKGKQHTQVVCMINNGERLARPTCSESPKTSPIDCPEKLYDMMLRCWNISKFSRPTFSYLSTFFGDYYQETEQQYTNEKEDEDEDED